MLRVISAFQIGQNVHQTWSQIWTAFFVNGWQSHWESAFCDTLKSSSNYPLSFRRSRHLYKFIPHNFDRKTEDASCCRKICAVSADGCIKREPCHSQPGAVWSFECWWKLSEKCHKSDETWVYAYDVETNVQLSQWMGKLSPQPKKSTSELLKCEGDVHPTLQIWPLQTFSCSRSWNPH